MKEIIAPCRDYAGSVIKNGDTIIHPDGDKGIVINRDGNWIVKYRGGAIKPLNDQVGHEGMAIKFQRSFLSGKQR